MKLNRLTALLLVIISVFSCVSEKDYEDSKSRIDASEKQIATVNEQIAAINSSITQLESTDAQLKEYIQSLQTTAGTLQESIEANAKEIESVESQLSEAIDAAKLEQLEALKALEEELTGKLNTINLALADLQAKDAELESNIADLKDYVEKELKNAKDWATATFSTIEQYNSTVTTIAGIKADIESINLAISNLETSLTSKISDAIATLENNLKNWVNTQLTAYYTIAQIDAKVAIIEKKIENADEELKGEISTLKTQLSQQKSDITEAYKKAISDAITSNNGVIDGKIQTAVDEVNGRITSEVASINQQITGINNRLNGIEESIAEILGMIQSIVVVPSYSDGDVALGEDETTLYFEILPLDAAKKLESVELSAFSLKAISTIQTKADVEYKALPIKSVKYEDDLVKITTSGKEVSQDFFNGVLAMNARLSITDGLNSLSSSFFGLKPQGDVDITSLRMAEYKKKIVNRLILGSDNVLILAFVDGSSIELEQHSVAPRLFLDYDGYWSVSYNNGETTSRLMDNNAEFIKAGNLQVDDIVSVRFVEDINGRYSYQTYQSASPETTLDELGTPITVDHKNTVLSIVENHVHNTITITTIDGQTFTFRQARIVPTGINVLTNKIKLAKGSTVYVEFRVNASNASFNYDVTSSNCEISLDFLGDATKSSYVTTPTNYKVTAIEQVYDKMGVKKEGQYRAYISDLGVSTNYDELVSLVLTINDGLGQTVQLSSAAIELFYSNELFTSFSILKENNSGILGDCVATIEGNNITILTPYVFDESALVASFTTSGSKVYANGELQESGVSVQNFRQPVKYYVDKNEYVVTLKKSGLPVVVIDTPGAAAITSKEIWTENSAITIYNSDGTVDYQNSKLNIRGRGNSTWGFPKKPYALKLDKKASILGMPKHKRWVLLANWLDRTLLRNDVSFYISKQTGLEWTPRGQFVEVILNGKHIGNFYLCEQIKIDENRVNIHEMKASDVSGDEITGGYLLELDKNYDEVNKFKSAIRELPYMFKEPDEEVLQPDQLSYFQNFINEMENKLYADNWLDNREYEDYMDLASFVDWWFVHELANNGEPRHPKSSYMHKDRMGKLLAGPVWDFDWGTYTPVTGYQIKSAIYYNRLFSDPTFVTLVKNRWSTFKPHFNTVPDYIRSIASQTQVSNDINITHWPISMTVNGDEGLSLAAAIERMISAYQQKLDWLDTQINNM